MATDRAELKIELTEVKAQSLSKAKSLIARIQRRYEAAVDDAAQKFCSAFQEEWR